MFEVAGNKNMNGWMDRQTDGLASIFLLDWLPMCELKTFMYKNVSF